MKPVIDHGGFWETMPWKGDGKMLWNYITYNIKTLLTLMLPYESRLVHSKVRVPILTMDLILDAISVIVRMSGVISVI